MKRLTVTMGFAALLAAALQVQAQEVILKVHHFLPPPSTAHAKFITPWCDKINKESGGKPGYDGFCRDRALGPGEERVAGWLTSVECAPGGVVFAARKAKRRSPVRANHRALHSACTSSRRVVRSLRIRIRARSFAHAD